MDRHLQYISEYLGPFTKEFLDRCPEVTREMYFDEECESESFFQLR